LWLAKSETFCLLGGFVPSRKEKNWAKENPIGGYVEDGKERKRVRFSCKERVIKQIHGVSKVLNNRVFQWLRAEKGGPEGAAKMNVQK